MFGVSLDMMRSHRRTCPYVVNDIRRRKIVKKSFLREVETKMRYELVDSTLVQYSSIRTGKLLIRSRMGFGQCFSMLVNF